MTVKDKQRIDLIYGTDPYSEDDISLLVVNQEDLDLLWQMQGAKNWGEALDGFPKLLKDINQQRAESDHAPLVPADEFDFETESAPDGLAYLTAVRAEMRASDFIGKLDNDLLRGRLRFEYGMIDCNRCFIKDDETAAIILRLLELDFRNPSLTRDDALISWFQQGLFG